MANYCRAVTKSLCGTPLLAAAWSYHHFQLHVTTIIGYCIEVPSLATAWNYHHWQLHAIIGNCMELPSLAAAWNYHQWQLYGATITGSCCGIYCQECYDWPHLGVFISGRNTINDNCIGKQLLTDAGEYRVSSVCWNVKKGSTYI